MEKTQQFLIVLLLHLCAAQFTFAQGEGNIWYFGNHAGLDFNGGAPVGIGDGALATGEGVATLSDASGSLLFYSDGITVWDRTHAVMSNGTGLGGDPSSSQSAIIVPYPGTPSLFYLFTIDAWAGPNGFRYNIIDMTLNGGLGAVTTKNITLVGVADEKLTAVRHANGTDFWVIMKPSGTANYNAYLVNSGGLVTTPVVSTVGATTGGAGRAPGYLKASADGNRLAAAMYGLNYYQVFDFDNSTGNVSNPITLSSYTCPYGVEFSPDGTKLYATRICGSKVTYQFDLLAGSAAAINASVTVIGTTTASQTGAVQIGPDEKLYVAPSGRNYVAVINDPNALGLASNYVEVGVNLTPGTNASAGLPSFIQSFFAAEICDDGIDNDGDGLIDCADPECSGIAGCPPLIPTMGEWGLCILGLSLLCFGAALLRRKDNRKIRLASK